MFSYVATMVSRPHVGTSHRNCHVRCRLGRLDQFKVYLKIARKEELKGEVANFVLKKYFRLNLKYISAFVKS